MRLGRPLPPVYTRRHAAPNTVLFPDAGVPVLAVTDDGHVVLAETRSPRVTLYGTPLKAGYAAFAAKLRHRGWQLSNCSTSTTRSATMAGPHGARTVIRWTGHRVFAAVGIKGRVPAPCGAT